MHIPNKNNGPHGIEPAKSLFDALAHAKGTSEVIDGNPPRLQVTEGLVRGIRQVDSVFPKEGFVNGVVIWNAELDRGRYCRKTLSLGLYNNSNLQILLHDLTLI